MREYLTGRLMTWDCLTRRWRYMTEEEERRALALEAALNRLKAAASSSDGERVH